MKLEPWQRAIALRESRRLENFVRRWRWAIIGKVREDLRSVVDRVRIRVDKRASNS